MLHSIKEPAAEYAAFEDVIARAHGMQGSRAVSELLRLSAALLEHCAYEMARSDGRGQVSRIILISAELERMAREAAAQ
ncbi:hypothetical protein CLG85_006410 [Yangia mangrovi]|uniref:Uncharacterized protein n=1 Tax=Alloyangia mangrovi TaxID=1779329 RepID=A0A2A3JWE8_9RHOB|nr:hypothetical protein [Alloyangia mangrovi]MCA0942923.1 hypothetical protein [Alloyangia pacifica]MCA0944125.1 hypothetical protein [Alloyangia pacifica]MCT4369984.1 hypothetical protein [Alloyangia mangrovi]